MLEFEWIRRRRPPTFASRVTFAEAATVFGDPLAVTFPDPDHSDDEDREITIGYSPRRRVLIVAHTGGEDRVRIISARRATKTERNLYGTG